ncbi:hypothetical protein COV82_02185 [Candidatus Peregrinibacteria bacterium CG11_big_fil_rev_8_21_14_0_20_46_8]|nr:MAG: hypothetical protein COV82_02185 [Candidatus Peregrinibacteria bacterium CG11_big_fil_rev_8_21_14_0_20_46_8]
MSETSREAPIQLQRSIDEIALAPPYQRAGLRSGKAWQAIHDALGIQADSSKTSYTTEQSKQICQRLWPNIDISFLDASDIHLAEFSALHTLLSAYEAVGGETAFQEPIVAQEGVFEMSYGDAIHLLTSRFAGVQILDQTGDADEKPPLAIHRVLEWMDILERIQYHTGHSPEGYLPVIIINDQPELFFATETTQAIVQDMWKNQIAIEIAADTAGSTATQLHALYDYAALWTAANRMPAQPIIFGSDYATVYIAREDAQELLRTKNSTFTLNAAAYLTTNQLTNIYEAVTAKKREEIPPDQVVHWFNKNWPALSAVKYQSQLPLAREEQKKIVRFFREIPEALFATIFPQGIVLVHQHEDGIALKKSRDKFTFCCDDKYHHIYKNFIQAFEIYLRSEEQRTEVAGPRAAIPKETQISNALASAATIRATDLHIRIDVPEGSLTVGALQDAIHELRMWFTENPDKHESLRAKRAIISLGDGSTAAEGITFSGYDFIIPYKIGGSNNAAVLNKAAETTSARATSAEPSLDSEISFELLGDDAGSLPDMPTPLTPEDFIALREALMSGSVLSTDQKSRSVSAINAQELLSKMFPNIDISFGDGEHSVEYLHRLAEAAEFVSSAILEQIPTNDDSIPVFVIETEANADEQSAFAVSTYERIVLHLPPEGDLDAFKRECREVIARFLPDRVPPPLPQRTIALLEYGDEHDEEGDNPATIELDDEDIDEIRAASKHEIAMPRPRSFVAAGADAIDSIASRVTSSGSLLVDPGANSYDASFDTHEADADTDEYAAFTTTEIPSLGDHRQLESLPPIQSVNNFLQEVGATEAVAHQPVAPHTIEPQQVPQPIASPKSSIPMQRWHTRAGVAAILCAAGVIIFAQRYKKPEESIVIPARPTPPVPARVVQVSAETSRTITAACWNALRIFPDPKNPARDLRTGIFNAYCKLPNNSTIDAGPKNFNEVISTLQTGEETVTEQLSFRGERRNEVCTGTMEISRKNFPKSKRKKIIEEEIPGIERSTEPQTVEATCVSQPQK